MLSFHCTLVYIVTRYTDIVGYSYDSLAISRSRIKIFTSSFFSCLKSFEQIVRTNKESFESRKVGAMTRQID